MYLVEAAEPAQGSGSGAKYAIDSRITKAIRDLATRFEYRLFLSATPHNGHSNSFSALLEILDPQRFTRGVRVLKSNRDSVMVRRLKDDIRLINGGFPKRHIVQIDLSGLPDDAPKLRLSKLLDEYRSVRQLRLADAARRQQTVRAAPARQPAFDLLADRLDSDDDRTQLPEDEQEAMAEAEMAAVRPPSPSRARKRPWRYRWPDDIRDEVLARLLALNAERAEQERLAAQPKPKPRTRKSPPASNPDQPSLSL